MRVSRLALATCLLLAASVAFSAAKAAMAMESPDSPALSTGRVNNLELDRGEHACADMLVGAPKTEEAVFLGVIEEGAYLADLRFSDGQTEWIPAGKVHEELAGLKKGDRVRVTFQDEQFWDDEGDGSCRQLTMVQAIQGLPAVPAPEAAAGQGGAAPSRQATSAGSGKNIATGNAPGGQADLSPNCDRPVTGIEKTICSDTGLAQLDMAMNQVYGMARARADSPDLVAQQEQWLEELSGQCAAASNIKQCIRDKYIAKIQQLSQYLMSPAAAPAN